MKLKQDLVEALEDNESCRVVQRKEEALRLLHLHCKRPVVLPTFCSLTSRTVVCCK